MLEIIRKEEAVREKEIRVGRGEREHAEKKEIEAERKINRKSYRETFNPR